MIVLRQLFKAYRDRPVLRGLDLIANPGVITLLVGANGAGKTTTLRICAGLLDADDGAVTLCGHDLRRDRRRALAQLSFLPQAPRFHPRLTVRQVAEFHARLRGQPRGVFEEALHTWGLEEHARTATSRLSGGLRQRLALAVFALADAPVLILDEPGLSLDPEWRERLQAFLVAEARRGRTIVVATHLLGEWEDRTDRCVLIADGRSAGEIAPGDLRGAFARAASSGRSPMIPVPTEPVAAPVPVVA